VAGRLHHLGDRERFMSDAAKSAFGLMFYLMDAYYDVL